MKQTKIYSCFPGTGKTHFFKNEKNLSVLDSDSSTFEKSYFPANYINHIESNIGKVDIILVSSHEEVRKLMAHVGIQYDLVYPGHHLGEEYLDRYEKRGSSKSLIDAITSNWTDWLSSCIKDAGASRHTVLSSGEYLSDVINETTIAI